MSSFPRPFASSDKAFSKEVHPLAINPVLQKGDVCLFSFPKRGSFVEKGVEIEGEDSLTMNLTMTLDLWRCKGILTRVRSL